jgi:plasmid maintenance system antidote protein VapI
MTTSVPKVVEIGNLSLLTNYLDSLYRYYFDHGFYVQNEIEKFIHEFEKRRGDSDLKSLVEIHSLQVDSATKLQESTRILSETTALLLAKIRDMTTKIQRQLDQEDTLKEQRRKQRNEKQSEQLRKYEEMCKQFEQSKKRIDEEFETEKQKMKEIYLIGGIPK